MNLHPAPFCCSARRIPAFSRPASTELQTVFDRGICVAGTRIARGTARKTGLIVGELGGDFVVDAAGRIAAAYPMRNNGDQVEIDQLLHELRRIADRG